MSVYPILFVLGLAAYVRSETCPPPDEIAPCECDDDFNDTKDIYITCNDYYITLKELKEAFNSLSGKQNVQIDLEALTLGTLPSNFFEGIGVKKIDISHCELDALTEDESRPPLLGLEDTLEELVIISSFTENEVPAKMKMGHLRKLREVNLSYNTITEMSNDWFDRGPASLEYLTVSNNGIEKLGDRAFANLINLQELFLDGNRFGGIRRSMLPSPANRLTKLELDNNALTDLPEDLFSNMPSLETLSIRTNGIARLEQRTFQPIWEQLSVFYAEGNPLECDSHMSWMFNLRVTSSAFGKCSSPEDKYGMSLQEFIDSRGQ